MEGEAGGAVTLFEMTRCCDLRALATPESQTGAPDFSKGAVFTTGNSLRE